MTDIKNTKPRLNVAATLKPVVVAYKGDSVLLEADNIDLLRDRLVLMEAAQDGEITIREELRTIDNKTFLTG